MSNEQLAHELLFDNTFQLEDSGLFSNEIADQIRKSFHVAFWDSLTDDLRTDTPIFSRVFRTLTEVHDGIKEVASASLDVSAVINIDLLQEQTRGSSLVQQWPNCQLFVDRVVKLISRVQAPKRDNQTAAGYLVIKELMAAADVDHPLVFCKVQTIVHFD